MYSFVVFRLCLYRPNDFATSQFELSQVNVGYNCCYRHPDR